MTEGPPVTWLLSTKNSMPYLPATLESIAAQTYRNHQVLAWDDCSTDGSLEELERWIPNRIAGQIFAGQSKRLGPSLAFLLEKADTEFCARIDGDDVNLPTRLERQVETMLQRPQLGVLGSYVEVIDEQGRHVDFWNYPPNDADARWLTRYSAQVAHPAVMLRRSLIQAAGGYQDFPYEDSDLWVRVCSIAEISNVPEVLLQYRRTGTSSTGTVIDWFPMLRQVAEANAASLFPGMPDPSRAMELWEATHPAGKEQAVRLRHLQELKTAAVRLARQAGKPDEYFTETEAFRLQQYHLRRRALQRLGLSGLIRLRERFSPSSRKA
jgi:glycosyltransferase involved in cell wall biosynthesis